MPEAQPQPRQSFSTSFLALIWTLMMLPFTLFFRSLRFMFTGNMLVFTKLWSLISSIVKGVVFMVASRCFAGGRQGFGFACQLLERLASVVEKIPVIGS